MTVHARVVYEGSRDDLRAYLRRLPAMLAGTAFDPAGIIRGLQLRLGNALVSKIQQAFVVKARGGVGEDGIKWAPLKRSTIAQRRVGKGDLAAIGIKGTQAKNRTRGLLTPAQDKRWRTLFARRKWLLVYRYGMDDQEASGKAAAYAWAILKQEGARTKLEVLGGRQVEILRDTGELARSFSPGVDDRPSGAEGQVMEALPGRVIVGTNKKPWHHRGTRRTPARPFWPLDGNLPESWWQAMIRALQTGLVQALVHLVTRGRV